MTEAQLVVLVDGRNVLRSRWPNLGEDELVERCRAWAAERGHRAVVVFDGEAPGALVGEHALDEHCDIVGSGGESADAWLVRTARHRLAHRRFWLVTSDRALRAAAGEEAERVVGGGTFLRELDAGR